MASVTENRLHGQTTSRRQLQYEFTPKHHGGDKNAARWLSELTFEEEFSIFDLADFNEISDDAGNMYGILRDVNDKIRHIGVWNEQMAEFPSKREGEVWHGYPVYPLKELAPQSMQ